MLSVIFKASQLLLFYKPYFPPFVKDRTAKKYTVNAFVLQTLSERVLRYNYSVTQHC